MTPEIRVTDAASVRPEMTAAIMKATGLDRAVLTRLVHAFYDRIRSDTLLAPVFAARITAWEPHLERMVEFWCSVALMTGGYHGQPTRAHAGLPVEAEHFDRWLDLFRTTARSVCSEAGAALVIERAERIARALHMNAQELARRKNGAPPVLG